MYKRYLKRFFDLCGALALFILLSPLMLAVALCICIDSKGPVLFRQQRVGKNEKIFIIFKYRTMHVETAKSGVPLSDMERMTRCGRIIRKLSLDELPQFVNIIRGEMSFIGPRPLLVQYLPLYSSFQRRRHEVLPGITGWAQVNGRNAISWEERFKKDVWYVENVSFILDIKIIGKTVAYVLGRKGVNQSTTNTMTAFTGNEEAGDQS